MTNTRWTWSPALSKYKVRHAMNKLQQALDRVPMEELQAAIARRGIQDPQQAIIQRCLKGVAKDHQLDAALIMSDDKYAPAVRARWDLYARLKEQGLRVVEIARMTGHPVTRVQYGLTGRFTKTKHDQ